MKNPFRRIDTTIRAAALKQPIEVGTVAWNRELTDALAQSSSTGKPVFALFQEVPGCSGCKQFGRDVLSDPLVVKAIENDFIPLLIHNNTGGRDAEVLAAYGEPSWNYQVVRFLNADGADIIERKDKVWSTGPLAERMIAVLESAGAEVPPYLRLVEQEHSDRLETAYIAQSCFWVGEMELGKIDGVVTTEAGWMGGDEVTAIQFDRAATTLGEIVDAGRKAGVVSSVYAQDSIADGVPVKKPSTYRVAKGSDQKRQIRGHIETDGMSAAQATKVNAFARNSKETAALYLVRD